MHHDAIYSSLLYDTYIMIFILLLHIELKISSEQATKFKVVDTYVTLYLSPRLRQNFGDNNKS